MAKQKPHIQIDKFLIRQNSRTNIDLLEQMNLILSAGQHLGMIEQGAHGAYLLWDYFLGQNKKYYTEGNIIIGDETDITTLSPLMRRKYMMQHISMVFFVSS